MASDLLLTSSHACSWRNDRGRDLTRTGLLVAGALICLSCTSSLPPEAAGDRSTSDSPNLTPGRSASLTSAGCASATAEWRQVNDLRGYNVHDGLAISTCELLLVGERLADRTAVVVESDNGGRTLVARVVTVASRLRRVLMRTTDLWALGEDMTGEPVVLRSGDRARSWSPMGLPLAEATDITSSEGRIVVSGRTASNAIVLAADGSNWTPALSLQKSAQVRALAAAGRIVAAGGVDQDRGLLYVSSDAGATFRAVELPSDYSAVTGLAVSDRGFIVIGGYHGKQVENATALSSRFDVMSGVLRDLELPPAVQLTSPVCTPEFCLAVTPTGRGDVVVRLQGLAVRWEIMSAQPTSVPLAIERIVIGQTTAYAVGTGSPLISAWP